MIKTRVYELMAIKGRQEGRRITQHELAEEVGVSLSSVKKWVNNEITRFDASHISAFCRYFDVGIGELFEMAPEDADEEGEMKTLALAG